MALIEASEEAAEMPGVRGFLNRNPAVVGGVVMLVAAAALYFAFAPAAGPKAYYTTDDGATFFVDSMKVAPFEKGGKEAVQAMVYTCDGQEKFVGYMIKYPPEVKARLEQALAKGDLRGPMPPALVKKPGEGEWVMQGEGAKVSAKKLAASGGKLPPKPADEVMKVDGRGRPGSPKLLTPE